jgi:hypothetical protein
MVDHPEFEAKCARARTLQADLMDDMVYETAKDCTEDNCHSAKVKISAYQWRASKLAPKKYGDNSTLLLGGDGGTPIKAAISVQFVKTGDASSQG